MLKNVKVSKVNSGVCFVLVNAKGQPSSRKKPSANDLDALYKAESHYRAEVIKAFELAGISNIGYATDFQKTWAKMEDGCLFLNLEPWGWAMGTFTEPVMNDSGSTPTSGRAKVLLCYQYPLGKKTDADGRVSFSKVYEVHLGVQPAKVSDARV